MRPVLRAAAALALLAACGDDPTQPDYDPQLDPADFVPQEAGGMSGRPSAGAVSHLRGAFDQHEEGFANTP